MFTANTDLTLSQEFYLGDRRLRNLSISSILGFFEKTEDDLILQDRRAMNKGVSNRDETLATLGYSEGLSEYDLNFLRYMYGSCCERCGVDINILNQKEFGLCERCSNDLNNEFDRETIETVSNKVDKSGELSL